MLIPVYRRKEIVAFTKIDLVDYVELSKFRLGLSGKGYVTRAAGNGVARHLYIARSIMGLDPGDPREVDHRNRNKLDNRRANLRVVTRAQNRENLPSHSDGTSSFRGVSWQSGAGKWQAMVRNKNLGLFSDEEKAAEAARRYREQHMTHALD